MTLFLMTLLGACYTPPSERKFSAEVQALLDAEPDNGEGRLYIAELADAIRKADRIVVTEHAYEYDGVDPYIDGKPEPKAHDIFVYSSKELTSSERASFMQKVSNLAPKTESAFAACIFEPRHTVTFYQAGKQTSALRICFHCGDIKWDGSRNTQPSSLLPALGKLIASIGMKEERDWRALALARIQRN
ncbi:MAG: hypothetical protein V4631_04145 [Pseudomonadota bacterium]